RPSAINPGHAAFTLNMTGMDFATGATVYVNGVAKTTNVVSKRAIAATLLAPDVATAQTLNVTVVNPGPAGGISNTALFPVVNPFTVAPVATSVPGGANPTLLAAGDFNNDGKLDIAVANAATHTVQILLGNGDGTFTNGGSFSVGSTVTSVPSAIAV